MTEKAKVTFPEFLRELADFYEARPALPEPYWLMGDVDISVYLTSRNAKETLASLGSFSKSVTDTHFQAKKVIGDRTVSFNAPREQVCVRRVVGRKMVDTQVIASYFKPE